MQTEWNAVVKIHRWGNKEQEHVQQTGLEIAEEVNLNPEDKPDDNRMPVSPQSNTAIRKKKKRINLILGYTVS